MIKFSRMRKADFPISARSVTARGASKKMKENRDCEGLPIFERRTISPNLLGLQYE